MRKVKLLSGSLLLASSTLAQAQVASRAEQIAPARVIVRSICPSEEGGVRGQPESLASVAISLASGIGADLFKAGLESVAAALEEASREKAIGGQGYSYFPFYNLTATPDQRVTLAAALGTGQAGCIVLSLDGTRGAAVSTPASLPKSTADFISTNLPQPAAYVEAELVKNGDSFVVRPLVVWYAETLRGLPRSRTAVELHASFFVPAGAEASSGAFAIARIPLPAMQPGEVMGPSALAHYQSPALQLRPLAGYVETQKALIEGLVATIKTERQTIEDERVNRDHAKQDLARTKAPDKAAKEKPIIIQRRIEAAERRKARAEETLAKLLPDSNAAIGTTSVLARLAFIRQPNRFGMAFAQALKARTPAMATSVETALKETLDPPAWTAAQTTYVQALGSVRTAQETYDRAMASTDLTQQTTTLVALDNAKAAANAAAAAAGKPLPYPDLLR